MTDWAVLARAGEGVGVSRCPEGHIHLDYRFATLRFSDEDFVAFARMVAEAARKIGTARASPVSLAAYRVDEGSLSRN